MGWREKLEDFWTIWLILAQDTRIRLGITNKVHILVENFPQCVDRTGYGLAMASDQGVEATHQVLASRMEMSKYVVKDKACQTQSDKLFRVK